MLHFVAISIYNYAHRVDLEGEANPSSVYVSLKQGSGGSDFQKL